MPTPTSGNRDSHPTPSGQRHPPVPGPRLRLEGLRSGGAQTAENISGNMETHRRGVEVCLRRAMRGNPELRGRVTVGWIIDPDGKATRASISESTLAGDVAQSCILEEMATWQFRAIAGAGSLASCTFVFEP